MHARDINRERKLLGWGYQALEFYAVNKFFDTDEKEYADLKATASHYFERMCTSSYEESEDRQWEILHEAMEFFQEAITKHGKEISFYYQRGQFAEELKDITNLMIKQNMHFQDAIGYLK